MKNEEFLKEFQYYKEHPEEYKHKKKGLMIGVSIVSIAVWFILVFTVMFMEKEETAQLVLHIAGYYTFVCFFIIAGMFIHLSYINERVIDFEDMIYKGLLSDLFPDINHPAIKASKDKIKEDLEYFNGISGSTAYEIYSDMKDKVIMEELEDKETAKKALDEINRVCEV